MKFKALVFPTRIGEAFGRWVTCYEKDAISANANFCKYCTALQKHHGATFDFSRLSVCEDDER